MVMITLIYLSTFFHLIWNQSSGAVIHAFHLSKAEVFYNENNRSLEISLHLFIDDLEAAMQNSGIPNPYISTSKEVENADSLISSYLTHHFNIAVDGRNVQFNFLGKEDSDDLIAIWCYLEGQEIINPKEIKIQNKLLVDLFDDQKNIVSFRSIKKKEFLLFDLKKQEATITL
jgi:hypothetical protein